MCNKNPCGGVCLRWKSEHMVVLAPGLAYVWGNDFILSLRRHHAQTRLQRWSDRVTPGSWLTHANLCRVLRTSDADKVS